MAVIGDMIVGIENGDGTPMCVSTRMTPGGDSSKGSSERNSMSTVLGPTADRAQDIVSEVEKHSKMFYIRANRCTSLYDDPLTLKGWEKETINGIEFELNSVLVEKWKGETYRLVMQRQKRANAELDLWEGEYT